MHQIIKKICHKLNFLFVELFIRLIVELFIRLIVELFIRLIYFSFLTLSKHLTLGREKRAFLCSHLIGVFVFHFSFAIGAIVNCQFVPRALSFSRQK